jgi:hypothetical protein
MRDRKILYSRLICELEGACIDYLKDTKLADTDSRVYSKLYALTWKTYKVNEEFKAEIDKLIKEISFDDEETEEEKLDYVLNTLSLYDIKVWVVDEYKKRNQANDY